MRITCKINECDCGALLYTTHVIESLFLLIHWWRNSAINRTTWRAGHVRVMVVRSGWSHANITHCITLVEYIRPRLVNEVKPIRKSCCIRWLRYINWILYKCFINNNQSVVEASRTMLTKHIRRNKWQFLSILCWATFWLCSGCSYYEDCADVVSWTTTHRYFVLYLICHS